MVDRKFPNSGAMFARQKRSEKAPDFGGQFMLENEVLDYVIRCAERGDPVELEISGWKRRTTNDGVMLGLKIELPYSVRSSQQATTNPQQGRGTYRSQPRQGGEPYRNDPYRNERPRNQDYRIQNNRQSGNMLRRDMNDDFPEEVRRGPRPADDRPPWED